MSFEDETAVYAKEDEGEDDEEVIETKEHIVFMIDAAASMFNTKIKFLGQERSTFEVSIQVALDCMKRKILISGRDEFAVVLYNTAKKSETKGCEENVYVYVERDVPSVNEMQALNKLTDELFQRDIGTFEGDVHLPTIENLEKAFATAAAILQGGRQTVKGKHFMPKPRIFLFTNEELPKGATDPGYKSKLIDRVGILKQIQASLAVFPLNSVLNLFNYAPFWLGIQEMLPDEEGYDPVQGLPNVGPVEERMQALFDNLQKRMEKRRPLASLLLNIPGGVSIGCQTFKLTAAPAAPKSVYVHAQTNELIVPRTRHELATTGTHVAPSLEQQREKRKEYKRVFKAVDKKNPDRAIQAVFDADEVAYELRGLYNQGIELLGFKPISMLQDYYNLSTSTFVRPAEKKVRGSNTAFKALLDAMLDQNKMAICRYTRNPGTRPKMVALVPQAQALDTYGYQINPEGMHLIPLPFADEIRAPEKQTPVAEPEAGHVQAAAACIDQLPYEYELGLVPDPALHHHFNVLEAMALMVEPPTVEQSREADQTLEGARNEDIDEQAGQELEDFKVRVLGPDYVPYQAKTKAGTKRQRVDHAGLANTYANIPWADMIRTGEAALMKRTAEDLRVYLNYHRLPVSGVKKDLASRILKHAHKD